MGETLESMEKENVYDDCPHFTEECRERNCIECANYDSGDDDDHVPEIIDEIENTLDAYEISDDSIGRILDFVEKELYQYE